MPLNIYVDQDPRRTKPYHSISPGLLLAKTSHHDMSVKVHSWTVSYKSEINLFC